MKKELFEETIENIRKDRDLTVELLDELRNEINSGATTHGYSGNTAAKYVETLQRSNEQLVKVITLLQKDSKAEEDLSLSKEETNNLFEIIQGNGG
jgi:hypothetical protein|tara:strand:- start:142 stop:429 length:288 start_codon:yes stop_codon:yes gene_type:complete